MAKYDGPIIDAHHHIWEIKNYPWLMAEPTPKMFGPYEPLRKDYLVDDLLDDFKNQNVEKSVHIQANWDPSDPVAETKWLQEQADKTGFPHAIIAFANLAEDGVGEVIKGHLAYANTRGIRQQLMWHENELWRGAPRPDLAATDEFQRGFAHLGEHDLSFEMQIFPYHDQQLASALDLLGNFPKTPVVLSHGGMLPLKEKDKFHKSWKAGMEKLAKNDNLHCKISGLALLSWEWTEDQLNGVISDVVDIFGADRVIYGSNFPLEKMWASYDELCGAVRNVLAQYSEEDQKKILHDNAAAFYRI